MFLWDILGESFFKVTPVYNSRGLPSGWLQKLLPSYIRLRLPLPHLPNTAKEAAPYVMGTLSDDILSGM